MHSRMILMEADALKKKQQADAAAVQVVFFHDARMSVLVTCGVL